MDQHRPVVVELGNEAGFGCIGCRGVPDQHKGRVAGFQASFHDEVAEFSGASDDQNLALLSGHFELRKW